MDFLANELQEATSCFKSVADQISALEKVIYKNNVLTNELEKIGVCLTQGEIYSKWRNFWNGPDSAT